MKILKTETNWDETINVQMTLKEFKLLRDCLFSVSYAKLEGTDGLGEIPYSFDEMQETIKQTDEILTQLISK